MLSSRECITWSAVYVIEHVAIVILNAVTIVAFMKNCNLRKRSTYLLVNLAIVDMLVGLTGPWTVYELGMYCKLWQDLLAGWAKVLGQACRVTFIISSLLNITVISLERLHATVCPFRHRFVKKWVYWIVIVVNYLVAALISATLSKAVNILSKYSFKQLYLLFSSFTLICIFVVFCSYILILIKVRCSPQPRHHVKVSRERKLTVTLFIVTFVSLLAWLPYIVQSLHYFTSFPSHLACFVVLLLITNSLVNPLLYAIRIPEFKRTLKAMFCKTNEQRGVGVSPLHAIRQ